MKRYISVGLAMVASTALGAAAVQTLHAQTKPPAYNIAEMAAWRHALRASAPVQPRRAPPRPAARYAGR
jgi:hypothetical protein